MNPLALLLHTWRLRRIRWAMRTLDGRLAAYEAAYGRAPFQTENLDEGRSPD